MTNWFFLLSIVGALGTVFYRSLFGGVLFFLLTLLSVCGILELRSQHDLASILFWFLGGTSLFLLLHTSLTINQQNRERSPRRLLVGKTIFILVAVALAYQIISQVSLSGVNITMTDQVEQDRLLYLILATTPFLLVGTFLLIRREDKTHNLPSGRQTDLVSK